ncbi:hypothetical protein, partial [Candidatus Sordicultor fermentans]|uniref:hypothetical protein n=1 Tax=Candidatus Sordicultor fermentans TaxID=1953203 RepID=UPI003908B5E2
MTKSTIKGRCPLITPQKRKPKRQNERSKITRRKSLRVVTPEASIIPLSLIPEWFYEGSKLLKGKFICIGKNIRKHSLLHFKKQATLY